MIICFFNQQIYAMESSPYETLVVTLGGDIRTSCSYRGVHSNNAVFADIFYCADLPGFLAKKHNSFQVAAYVQDGALSRVTFPEVQEIKNNHNELLPIDESLHTPTPFAVNPTRNLLESANALLKFIELTGIDNFELSEEQNLLLNNMKNFIKTPKFNSPLKLIVNGQSIVCKVDPSKPNLRFVLCEGSNYDGVLDLLPEGPNYTPMPMILYANKYYPSLRLSKIIDANGQEAFGNKLTSYSNRHYDNLETLVYMNELSKLCCFVNDFEIVRKLQAFLVLLKKHQKTIKDLDVVQCIKVVDASLSSYFDILDYSIAKDNRGMSCLGLSELSPEHRAFYETLIHHEGIEPSEREAQEIFDEIVNRLREVPFDYTNDGCYARAHIVANWLHDRGYHAGKVWLKARLANPFNPQKHWAYHVAASIYIKKDAHIEIQIIDPSPENHTLLTIEEWIHLNNIAITPRTIAFPVPQHSVNYEEAVIAYSSHIPLWPYNINIAESLESTLQTAKTVNEKYLKLCKSISSGL